jgi:hypothetical protein
MLVPHAEAGKRESPKTLPLARAARDCARIGKYPRFM